jgi:type IV pilus assembly protein PilE
MSEASEMQVSAYRHTATQANQRGFTLIEAVVVMAMVAILAAIAIPNYSEYVLRSHRSTAQSFMSDVASRQTQFFLDRRLYAAVIGPDPDGRGLNMQTPEDLRLRYTFTIDVIAGPPPGFRITATPIGAQAGDRCGVMTIDQTGAKRTATDAARCW